MRNTRDANNFVHAKKLASSASRAAFCSIFPWKCCARIHQAGCTCNPYSGVFPWRPIGSEDGGTTVINLEKKVSILQRNDAFCNNKEKPHKTVKHKQRNI